MHKLVHVWSYDRLDADNQVAWSLVALELLGQAVKVHHSDLSVSTRLLPHVTADFATVLGSCGSNASITDQDRAAISTVGDLLRRFGRWKDECSLQRFLVQVTQRTLGDQHSDTLASMKNLALVLGRQGEYEQAVVMHRQTLELMQKVLGSEHRKTLTSMNSLASVVSARGECEEVEHLLNKS